MAATFQLTIVSATGKLFDGEVEAVRLPGTNGSFGILAHHTPLISALEQGIAKVTVAGGEDLFFMVGDGYVEVAANSASVIVGEAVRVKDLETGLHFLAQPHPWDAAARAET